MMFHPAKDILVGVHPSPTLAPEGLVGIFTLLFKTHRPKAMVAMMGGGSWRTEFSTGVVSQEYIHRED